MAIVAGLVCLVFLSALLHAIPFPGDFRGPRTIDLVPRKHLNNYPKRKR
jgi:hypothetical protein